jgi:DUF971 family protein
MSAQEVGRYALVMNFSDGHNTGIYRYDFLRDICECDKCQAERGQKTRKLSV